MSELVGHLDVDVRTLLCHACSADDKLSRAGVPQLVSLYWERQSANNLLRV